MRSVRVLSTAFLILALAFTSALLVRPALAQGQAGTTLQDQTVTAVAHWTRTFAWTIDKSVDQSLFNLFKGDSDLATYTINVTKNSGTDHAWIDGEFCTTNGGDQATVGLAATAVLRYENAQNADVINTAPVNMSSNPVLDPNERGCWNYQIDIPTAYVTGGHQYRVDIDITITNHSGHLGTPFGPSPANTAFLPGTPVLINNTINVDDTNGLSFEFSDTGSASYDVAFTCNGDRGSHHNVATIRQTGQSDDADVQVNCYELTVAKTATTTFDRTYQWDIAKSADQTALTLSVGQQFLVNYGVRVWNTGYTDSNWAVAGTITVSNPAPMPAPVISVSESIPGAIVTCPADLTIPAGGTLECTYSAVLTSAATFTNTATATLQNTPSGTTNFSGSAEVVFGARPTREFDRCVDVNDTFGGYLGRVCLGDAGAFTYTHWIGPYAACGQYTVENVASLITLDKGLTDSANWIIAVNVPCGGCTLTPGYWKTHSILGPAPYDETWAGREFSPFYSSLKNWYSVLWTPPAGNPYYQLSFQYIAAVLNGLNGAYTPPGVVSAMSWADDFFRTYAPNATFSKSMKSNIVYYAGILSNYNAGYIGPGHCNE